MSEQTPFNLIVTASSYFTEQASELAASLNLPFYVSENAPVDASHSINVTELGVSIQQLGKGAPGAVRVDFVEGALAHRRKFGGGKSQSIAKAVGAKSGVKPRVIDMTAGLGRDSFVLACLGCQVAMIERSAVVGALLQDGLSRAKRDFELHELASRMQLHVGNSVEVLENIATEFKPEVIYCDPMFPERNKSALVKKEMRLFHQIVGEDLDADAMLAVALDHAINRVVVKRPKQAPFLAGQEPSYQLLGKANRFDIYTIKAFGKD